MRKPQGNLSLFRPDLFSAPVPVFSETSKEKLEIVKAVLEAHYANLELGEYKILQCGGMEINSNNYRVDSEKGSYLLKRIKLNNNFENLTKKAQINNWLNAEKSPLPRIFEGDNNDLVIEHLGDAWCLFQFYPGSYFHTGSELLAKIGSVVGKMHSSLKRLPKEFIISKNIEYFKEEDWDFIQKLAEGEIDECALIKDQNAEDFVLNFPALQDALKEILFNRKSIEKAQVQVSHLDLHPHNILVLDNSPVAIVDFESFHMMPLHAAVGFSIFKLMRQFLSSTKNWEKNPEEIEKVRRSFIESLGEDNQEAESSFHLMAKVEVLRRIIYILQSNFYRNDPTWNHVLLIQMVGLLEIDAIFLAKTGLKT